MFKYRVFQKREYATEKTESLIVEQGYMKLTLVCSFLMCMLDH